MPTVVHHGDWGTNHQQQVLAQSMGNMARTFLSLGNRQLQDKKLEQDAAKAALAAEQWEQGFQQREAQFQQTMEQRQTEFDATQQHRADQLELQREELQRAMQFDAGKLEAQRLANALNRGLGDTQAESLSLDQDAQRIRNRQSEVQLEQGQFDLQQARERDAILKEDRDALNSYFGANGLGLTPGKDFEEAFPSAASLYAFQQLPKSSRDQ